MIEKLTIWGVFSNYEFSNLPKEWSITGYLTNQGRMYSLVTDNNSLSLDVITKKEVEKKIKSYYRKDKLNKLNKND